MEKWDLLLELLQSELKNNGDKNISIKSLVKMMMCVDEKYENDNVTYEDVDYDDCMWK